MKLVSAILFVLALTSCATLPETTIITKGDITKHDMEEAKCVLEWFNKKGNTETNQMMKNLGIFTLTYANRDGPRFENIFIAALLSHMFGVITVENDQQRYVRLCMLAKGELSTYTASRHHWIESAREVLAESEGSVEAPMK